jgi:hypothetical protein
VQQIKFEVDDLKECLLYEEEELGRFPVYLESLEWGVNQLHDAMCNNEYSFGREDLPFMEVANLHAEDIPFHRLLQQINETHRKGLDVAEDN